MKKIIHHLRKQPEEVRRHVLHITMFFIILLLIGLWIFTLGRNINDPSTQQKIAEDINEFSSLKDSVVEGYSNITDTGIEVQN